MVFPAARVKPFTGGIRLKPGEVLVTAVVGYPSWAARKRINKAIEMTISTFETIVEV